jgi:hypothetical protein
VAAAYLATGHVEPQVWRRYAALLRDGMRVQADQKRLDEAMRKWQPAG